MNCVFCKSDIENDSFHCDQCGKEILICSKCGKPGKGKNCIDDGNKLYSPKIGSLKPSSNVTQFQNNVSLFVQQASPVSIFNPSPDVIPENKPAIISEEASAPTLKLINNHLQIDIEIYNYDIIGRSSGNFSNIFSQFSQISGQHAQFVFESSSGWSIKDLNSTNGTAINHSPNWQNVAKIKPHSFELITNNSFILLANIEFQVKIFSTITTAGTQRL
jgi:hypothetical protein